MRAASGVAVETRPPQGLLGGMLGLPTTDWREDGAAARLEWIEEAREIGEVKHVFTHFELRLNVLIVESEGALPDGYELRDADSVAGALPSVFRKALKLAS